MVDVITSTIGIILALIASFSFNIAVVLQKKGLMAAPNIKVEEGVGSVLKSFKALFQNKTWLVGFLLGVIGWFPYIIAIGMVSVLVVAPLVSVGLIIFVFAAKKMLNEKTSPTELLSIIILIIATILIAFARISSVSIDLNAIVVPFFAIFGVLIGISVGCFFFAQKKRGTPFEGLFLVFTGATLYSLGIVCTNIFTQSLLDAHVFPLFFWEFMFGIFYFLIFLSYVHLWMFLGFWLMLIFNITSIIFYQSGFQKGKTVVMFPIFNIITIIIPVVIGLLIFQQSYENSVLFFVAMVLILIATFKLSKFQSDFQSKG